MHLVRDRTMRENRIYNKTSLSATAFRPHAEWNHIPERGSAVWQPHVELEALGLRKQESSTELRVTADYSATAYPRRIRRASLEPDSRCTIAETKSSVATSR
jgi:hypothetical protein